jgi:transcriptional regulator with XRE-family HTH domain
MNTAMLEASDRTRRLELGEFLRAQRARLKPADLGLPQGIRRRTPGLRREEVAQLCGLSTTWYSWLEQGRDISLSAAALGRIATVLRLSAAERAYLFDLAARRDPRDKTEPDSPAPQELIDSLRAIACPAYVLDHRWNALGWNAAAEALFVGWLGAGDDHNLLRFIFLSPASRSLIVDWPSRARRVLAEFRADTSRHLEDRDLRALVAELSEGSPFFAEQWHTHAVLGREGGSRYFDHPAKGRLAFQQLTLNPSQRPDLKLVLLVPPG